jgi:hypothetical protein
MIAIIETVFGNKPQEQIEFLSLSHNGKTKHMIANNKGNGYIKLFEYQYFFEFYCLGNAYVSLDITLDLYNNDKAFEKFINRKFFASKPKKMN